MDLLRKEELIRTGPVDHADWNYSPVLSFVSRRRFALVLSMLPSHRVGRMLEIGFGSGVFMPELRTKSEELYGIDVHDEVANVKANLSTRGTQAELSRQSAEQTNFPDRFFEVAVAVSSLEFIPNIGDAASEIWRILAPCARLIAVMPAKSRILDFALRMVTGEDAERDYEGRRERVLPAFQKYFTIAKARRFFPIYTAYEFSPIRSS